MTELEQYKKAYARLVGNVDRVITALERLDVANGAEQMGVILIAAKLTSALKESEEIFLSEDPEE